MPETNITSSDISDYSNTIKNYSVDSVSIDGSKDQKETKWMNTKWTSQLGMYKSIPELKISIDAKSVWTIGKGFKSNEITEMLLMSIKGNGKQTFNSIISNLIRTYHIGGDAYAEIIRDNDGVLINLKILDPERMSIVANKKGMLIRYEQSGKGEIKKFEPEEILHLSRNRVADELHGESLVNSVEWIILARNEAMADYKKLLHRNIYPVRIWHLDTDLPAKVSGFKAKVASAKYSGEDIFIPKGAVEQELASIPANSILDSKAWIVQLNNAFFQATGVPQVIVGGSMGMTDGAVKIEYLAFEQTIESEQLYIEEEILSQLNLEIELEFPASLKNELISDEGKSESMQATTQEDTGFTGNETTAGKVAK